MRALGENSGQYWDILKERVEKSRSYHPHQVMGLEVATLLEDLKHKALYIKLAKKHGSDKILRLAKMVAENKNIKNKGGYFMKVLYDSNSGQ